MRRVDERRIGQADDRGGRRFGVGLRDRRGRMHRGVELVGRRRHRRAEREHHGEPDDEEGGPHGRDQPEALHQGRPR